MDDVEQWIKETQQFAGRLGLAAGTMRAAADSNIDELKTAAQGLLRTTVDGLPLMSDCMAMRTASAMGRSAVSVDPETAEHLAPIVDGAAHLSLVTQRGGSDPIIWAQGRDGLLDGVPPLPGKTGKVFGHLKWVEGMNKSVVKGLEGVAEEIDQQDGSGAAKAKEAAKELEEKANNPPQKQSLILKIAEGISSFIKWVFD